jgi:hypothetical protein
MCAGYLPHKSVAGLAAAVTPAVALSVGQWVLAPVIMPLGIGLHSLACTCLRPRAYHSVYAVRYALAVHCSLV